MKYSSILWGVITLCLLSTSTQAKDLFVIDIGYQTSDVTLAQQIAVLSCQGLMNRNEGKEKFSSLRDQFLQLYLPFELYFSLRICGGLKSSVCLFLQMMKTWQFIQSKKVGTKIG